MKIGPPSRLKPDLSKRSRNVRMCITTPAHSGACLAIPGPPFPDGPAQRLTRVDDDRPVSLVARLQVIINQRLSQKRLTGRETKSH